MAEVDVVMAPAADAQQQKRSFAADITNQGESQPKKPKQDPKELVLFEWSVEDMANSKARVDATKAARACRRPYGVTATVQTHHAPKSLSPKAAFYEHEGANPVAAMQARRSGVAPSLADGSLDKRPLFGGMADVSNAPAAPATIVGLDEVRAASGAHGREVKERKKRSYAGWSHAGVIKAPQFRLWLSIKEGPEDTPWYHDVQMAVADCKRRWPVETAKGYPDYATTKITGKIVEMLRGKSPRKVAGRSASEKNFKRDRDISKWKLAWKKPGA